MKQNYNSHVKQYEYLWTEYSALPWSDKKNLFDRKFKRVNTLSNHIGMIKDVFCATVSVPIVDFIIKDMFYLGDDEHLRNR